MLSVAPAQSMREAIATSMILCMQDKMNAGVTLLIPHLVAQQLDQDRQGARIYNGVPACVVTSGQVAQRDGGRLQQLRLVWRLCTAPDQVHQRRNAPGLNYGFLCLGSPRCARKKKQTSEQDTDAG